jgi:hypothetical protein
MTNGLLINGEIFGHFLIYYRKPFLIYSMILQRLHSEFPYIWGKLDFLYYQCIIQIGEEIAPFLQDR